MSVAISVSRLQGHPSDVARCLCRLVVHGDVPPANVMVKMVTLRDTIAWVAEWERNGKSGRP